MKTILLHDGWKLSHFDPAADPSADRPPHGWRAAQVPGTVQTSPFGLPREKLYRGTRVREVQWMEKRLWVYRRALQVPRIGRDETVRLVFAGLDYRHEVWIDGNRVAAGEGMFHPVPVALDAFQGRKVAVEVRLFPPPPTRAEHVETTKAQFSRGWDFAPEMRTVGIWDEARLEVAPRLRVEEAFIETRIENSRRARVTVRMRLSGRGTGRAEIALCGSRRSVPFFDADHVTALVEVESPRLWWPNGLGKAELHDLAIRLRVNGRRTEPFVQRVGLREVGRVPAAGQRPADIPLQFTVNGLPFFINGLNWVPPDAAVGDIRDAQYDRQLEAFRKGGANLVRVWGGGLREKRRFYERCDELGLLVFQEYPIACGMGTTERYFAQLESEARAIARDLRRHPSLFLLSGGNENYHYWRMLDGEDPVLRQAAELARRGILGGPKKSFGNREWLAGAVRRYEEPVHLILGGVTVDEAPHVLYQNTSAMEGEGEVHGTWTWNPRIGDHRYRGFASVYDYWRAADQHLYSEASVSSIANLATIREVTGKAGDRMPDSRDEVWKLHHAFHGAWDKLRDNWLDLPSTEKVFGPVRSLRELVVLNQYLQGEGGRYMVEELRRKQPRVSGVIWWGVNEPWPGLAGNALIDYHGRPKLSWPIVSNSFRPTILSLRYAHLLARPFRAELWLSCNAPEGFRGSYRVEVSGPKGIVDRYEGACGAAYRESRELRVLLPVSLRRDDFLRVKTVLLDGEGRKAHENLYFFGACRGEVLKRFGPAIKRR